MELQFNEILEKRQPFELKANIRSERDELNQMFLAKLNPDRIKAGFKPLTAVRLNMMFSDSQLKTSDLWAFYRECERAKHFSKYFYWALKGSKK